MVITSRQRAQLRAKANALEAIVHIGKDGVTQAVLAQADEALLARELIKCSVQQNSAVSAREACDALCAAVNAQPVSVIGRKFVVYRQNED